MDLKQLKAALDAAEQALAAKPDDADLKSKHQAAKSAYEAAKAAEDDSSSGKKGDKGDQDDDEGEKPDESDWDPKTKAYIEKLRRESAKHRTKGNNLEKDFGKLKQVVKELLGEDDDEVTPEKLEGLKGQVNGLSFQNAALQAAIEHGVGKDQIEYFEFLLGKRAAELGDGEELSQEDIADIAKKANGASGGGSGSGKFQTSVGEGRRTPDPGKKSDITLDQFARMTVTEKSDLYVKNRALYDQLLKEAKEKRRL